MTFIVTPEDRLHYRCMISILQKNLALPRCPHCGVAKPNLAEAWFAQFTFDEDHEADLWKTYRCSVCTAYILAYARIASVTYRNGGSDVEQQSDVTTFPASTKVADQLPARAKRYLEQAIESLNSPDGAVMLAASSIDAMLKDRGLKEGSLYRRIDEAARSNLITEEMALWAHEVRLDANDQRHADESTDHHTLASARRVVDFAVALGEFLFVLPARVAEGRGKTRA